MDEVEIVWTDYLRYRVELRGFDLAAIERILRRTTERYVDAATGRLVAIGRHQGSLVLVPYEQHADQLTPVTVHVTSRRQVNVRLRSGRFRHE